MLKREVLYGSARVWALCLGLYAASWLINSSCGFRPALNSTDRVADSDTAKCDGWKSLMLGGRPGWTLKGIAGELLGPDFAVDA